MDSIDWKIITYESDRGEKPIDEFLKKQQAFTRAKIIHNIGLLRTYGNLLTMPHVKMLGSGLFELRIRGKEELQKIINETNNNLEILFEKKGKEVMG